MRVALLAAALVFAGGCTPVDAPKPTDGSQAGTLERCTGGDVDDSIPSAVIDPEFGEVTDVDPDNTDPNSGGPPPQVFLYCMQLAGPNGSDDVIQVAAVSNQPQSPAAGRRLLAYHPGGPGISPVRTLFEDQPQVDLDEFLVITWDGRTSSTTPGSCGPVTSAFGIDRELPDAGQLAAIAEECLRPIGSQTTVGSIRGAAELDLIRKALGFDTVSLLTHSYGTAIAEAYRAIYGGSLDRAVMDGPVALQLPWTARVAFVDDAISAGVDGLLASCDHKACESTSFDDLRRSVRSARPVVGSGALELTTTMFDQATLLALRSDTYWPGFFDGVSDALAGDGTTLWGMGEQQYFDVDRSVYYESICADIEHPFAIDGYIDRVDSSVTRTFLTDLAPCAGHQASPAPLPDSQERSGDVLLLASRYDPYAPAAMIGEAGSLATNSTVCLTDRKGHTSYALPGMSDAVGRFLHDGDVTDLEDVCADVHER